MKDRSGNDLKIGQQITITAVVRGVYAHFVEAEVTGTDEELRDAAHRPTVRISGGLVDGASEAAEADRRFNVNDLARSPSFRTTAEE